MRRYMMAILPLAGLHRIELQPWSYIPSSQREPEYVFLRTSLLYHAWYAGFSSRVNQLSLEPALIRLDSDSMKLMGSLRNSVFGM